MIGIEFRQLRLHTRSGQEATYQFGAGVNLVVGPFGSGKTSLLELLKYGLGGNAEHSQTVQREVTAVVVECKLSNQTWRFRREFGSSAIEVYSSGGELETTLHTRGAAKMARPSQWMLGALGLPQLRVRRAKRAASGAAEPLSFFDFYAYMYLSQAEIDRSVVGHLDRDRDRKRRAVFEVMFGLTNERLTALEVEEGKLAEEIQRVTKERAAIEAFLERASTPPQETLREAAVAAARDLEVAQTRLGGLRAEVEGVAVLEAERRGEAASLVAATQDARVRLAVLDAQIDERRRLYANLALELERLERAEVAVRSLSGVEFARCPRCLQALARDRFDSAHCYVCGQPDALEADPAQATDERQRERRRLQSLRDEMEALLSSDDETRRALRFEVELLEEELVSAETFVAREDAQYVSPLFEAISSVSAAAAEAENRRRRAEELMRYWSELDGVLADIRQLQDEREGKLREVAALKADLERNRQRVGELSGVFREIVAESQLPWFEDATIDLSTYLPVINGGSFGALSSGGMKAVINVAYHLAILTEALVERDLRIPNALIVDSPAKNLGVSRNDRGQADRVYRRIAALAGAYQHSFQIIVADNDHPSVPVPLSNVIELSYERPLVPGVDHPGPGVPSLGDVDEDPS